MQLYALIKDNQIQVGPRSWNFYFFLEYLEDETLSPASLPKKAPDAAIITDQWKILPVTHIEYPVLDKPYEQLVGPYWTIKEDHITGFYEKTYNELSTIKGRLKDIVASNRYQIEVGKLEYTFSDGETVELFTEREERAIYLQTLSILPEQETVAFKFKGGKIRANVTKTELSEIVALGSAHIREAFTWEAAKSAEIESSNSIEELKLIELRHPLQILEEEENGNQ